MTEAPSVDDISCPAVSLCIATGEQHELVVLKNPKGSPAEWKTVPLPGSSLSAISCAGIHLCVVIERGGQAFSSTNPTGGPRAWHRQRITRAGIYPLTRVTCPSPHLCVTTQNGRRAIFTTTDPARPSARWHRHIIDTRWVDSISCSSAHFCVALAARGVVFASTAPARGDWHGDAGAVPGSGGSITCHSSTLCVAMRSSAKGAYVSTDPMALRPMWHHVALPSGGYPIGVACPSELLCIAMTSKGFASFVHDPAHGPWRGYPINGGPTLTGVSCPAASLCVAVDRLGNVLTSSDPVGGAVAWRASRIDQAPLVGVSCPTTTLCVAADGGGAVLTSTDPIGGAGAWSRTQVTGGGVLFSVSCPSSSLCIAGGPARGLYTSNDPAGGAWSGSYVQQSFGSSLHVVTCASAAFCLTGDDSGQVFGSTSPTGGPSSWTRTALSPDASPLVTGASCPSVQLCVVTTATELYTSTDPSANVPDWLPQTEVGRMSSVDCPSTTLCVAANGGAFAFTGEILASTDPTGGQSAWLRDGRDPLGEVTAISCVPATTTCVAVDNAGNVLTSS